MTTEVETEVVDDRRAALEAAITAAEESPAPAPAPAPEPAPDDDSGKAGIAPGSPEGEGAATLVAPTPSDAPTGLESDTGNLAVDKAPQSWRGPQKEKWAALDSDVRQEVMRREREITRTLNDTASERQLARAFNESVNPFMARIQSQGIHPIVAVQELFKADHILHTAPKVQRAQFMAKMISDYGVDIQELDNALAGKAPVDPVDSRVDQLLQQRLAPFQQYLTQQQQREQYQAQQEAAKQQSTIESMTNDPKYPHFNAVREDMADLIEISAKRGLYLSLEQAYNRATGMNPEVSKLVANQQNLESQKASAKLANARAQSALKASKSVSGAPSGLGSGQSAGNDRRASIEAAFEAASGR